jgi:hypothetical protein
MVRAENATAVIADKRKRLVFATVITLQHKGPLKEFLFLVPVIVF